MVWGQSSTLAVDTFLIVQCHLKQSVELTDDIAPSYRMAAPALNREPRQQLLEDLQPVRMLLSLRLRLAALLSLLPEVSAL